MTAESILQNALDTLKDRATQRDTPNGERSMLKAINLFNSIRLTLGHPLSNMSEQDGWLFMMCLKLARASGGDFREDDYIDLAGYAALLGETAQKDFNAVKLAKFSQNEKYSRNKHDFDPT